jgi:hypothetical protein
MGCDALDESQLLPALITAASRTSDGDYMQCIGRVIGFVSLLYVGLGSWLWAQVCRPLDASSEPVRHRLAIYAEATSGDDKTVRDSLHLPNTALISFVASESVCKKAIAAYQSALAGTGHGFSTRVYVIQVGTVYAVYDPVYHWGPDPDFYTVVIFDSRWRKLSMYNP